jgi:ankyrin repeat protein
MVKLLIRYGANVNACYGGWTILTSTLRTKAHPSGYLPANYKAIISLLLDAGASPNPSGVCKTPLQLAVELDHDIEVVERLLGAGALVNAVGSKDAVSINLEPRPTTILTPFDSASLESYNNTPLLMVEKKQKALKVDTPGYEAESSRLAFIHHLLTTSSCTEQCYVR